MLLRGARQSQDIPHWPIQRRTTRWHLQVPVDVVRHKVRGSMSFRRVSSGNGHPLIRDATGRNPSLPRVHNYHIRRLPIAVVPSFSNSDGLEPEVIVRELLFQLATTTARHVGLYRTQPLRAELTTFAKDRREVTMWRTHADMSAPSCESNTAEPRYHSEAHYVRTKVRNARCLCSNEELACRATMAPVIACMANKSWQNPSSSTFAVCSQPVGSIPETNG